MLRLPSKERGRVRCPRIQRERSYHCWKEIETESCEIGKLRDNREVSTRELVEKDSLNIKEVELFRAVYCWAEWSVKSKAS